MGVCRGEDLCAKSLKNQFIGVPLAFIRPLMRRIHLELDEYLPLEQNT